MAEIPPPPPGFQIVPQGRGTPSPPPGFRLTPEAAARYAQDEQQSADLYRAHGEGSVNPTDIAEQIGYGVARGVTAIPGAPVDIANMVGHTGNWLNKHVIDLDALTGLGQSAEVKPIERGGSEDMYRWLAEPIIGKSPEAATDVGRYAGRAAEFAVGGLASKPRNMLRMAGVGAGSGLAYEGAKDAAPDSPYAPLIAAIVAAAGLSAPSMVRRNSGDVLADALRGTGDADWQAAQGVMQRAQAAGVPLMGPEAMNNPALWGLASDIAATPHGSAMMGQFVQDRPAQVAGAVNQTIDGMGPRVSPYQAGMDAQAAAEGGVAAARGDRSAAARPYYEAARTQQADPQAIQDILDAINGLNPGRGTPLAADLARLEQGLTRPGAPGAAVAPETSIEALDNVYRTMRDQIDAPVVAPSAMGTTSRGVVGPLVGDLRSELMNNPNYAQGNAEHIRMSPPVVQAERGPMGTIARAEGDAGMPPVTRMAGAITDPATIRPADIQNVYQGMGRGEAVGNAGPMQPHAFRQLTQTYLGNELDKALSVRARGQQANNFAGADLAKSIYGSPQQRQNLDAMVEVIAQGQGIPAGEASQGLANLMEVLTRTGSVPAVGSRTAPRLDLAQQARQSLTAGAIDMASAQPLGALSRTLRNIRERGAYRDLARAFTAPDSLEQMRRLARMEWYDPRAQAIAVQILLGATGGDQSATAAPEAQ